MWEIIKTSVPEILIAGLKYTIPIAIISFILGIIIASITALIRRDRKIVCVRMNYSLI